MTDETRQLLTAFQKPVRTQADPYPYESRVLQGIWAAAPYLHNGSVPTLEELLKPAAERVESFPVARPTTWTRSASPPSRPNSAAMC